MITIAETDLVVHPLCLGGNVFGWSADKAQSEGVLDAYTKHGGNFIDTADVYSEWKEGNVGGESETIIGTWAKARGNRSELVIATKVAMLSKRPGLSAANIIAACDESLKRLQTDYIDLYYSHKDDEETPIEETLNAYAQLIAQGDFEGNQAPLLAQNSITCIPYFGLARGFLTGKYRAGVTVDSLRAGGVTEYQSEKGYAVVSALEEISKAHNSSIAAVALGWLRAQPQVSTPIASARTVEQLEEIIQVVELSSDEVAKLTKLSS